MGSGTRPLKMFVCHLVCRFGPKCSFQKEETKCYTVTATMCTSVKQKTASLCRLQSVRSHILQKGRQIK
jgi:hypothetical protein